MRKFKLYKVQKIDTDIFTWGVVPGEIAFSILNRLPIKPALKLKTQDFLAGKIEVSDI